MFRRIVVVLLVLVSALAATWLAVRRADIPYSRLEVRYTAETSEFVTLSNGLITHYTDEGPKDAPVLLLVHGIGSSVATWRSWRANLEDGYRVVAVDLPGHGLTRVLDSTDLSSAGLADFLGDFADAIGLDRFVLVGSSLGGHAAWLYAVDESGAFEGLVLIAASGLPPAPADTSQSPWVYKLAALRWLHPLLTSLDPEPAVRAGLESAFVDQGFVTEAAVVQYADLVRAPGHRQAILEISTRDRAAAGEDAEKLKDLEVSVLILQGQADEIIPPDHARRFHSLLPNSRLKEYPAVGHLPHEEAPMQTLRDLRAFLATVFTDGHQTGQSD